MATALHPQNDPPIEKRKRTLWLWEERTLWIWEEKKMRKRSIKFVPSLYNIYEKVLVKAADKKKVTDIRVSIDVKNGIISVWNNGQRVDAHKNDEYWKKQAIRYSSQFTIETAHGSKRSKKVFANHSVHTTDSELESSENWSKVSFKPNLDKFGMRLLEDDTVALMKRRVVDLAGCLGNSVNVELDGASFQFRTFEEYVQLYQVQPSTKLRIRTFTDTRRVYEKVTDRCEVCICIADEEFDQVSFVNNFATLKGGSHVDYITSQVTGFLAKIVHLKPDEIKSHLWVFVNAVIDNPAFDSQNKENLTTNKDSFGSTCELTSEFLKKVVKSDVLDRLLSYADDKRNEKLKKRKGKLNIPGLEEAYLAGTAESGDCTLILTVGDSAKAFAMSGLSYLGQDKYGMFPLEDNLLNLRRATNTELLENAEIQNIKNILGLQDGKSYVNKELRYGRLMIMADQDPDGSLIKGLLIMIFYRLWPFLLRKKFMCIFKTPIVKASYKNNNMVLFHTMREYLEWKRQLGNEATKYKIKYYKGLETIESKGVKYCYDNLDQHIEDLYWVDDKDDYAIDLAFSKMKIKERNDWLRAPEDYFDPKEKHIRKFINTEFKQYAVADLQRSIPSMVDGLKPGQRKILFSAFKKPITQEIEVGQFSVYVYQHSAYHHHHGEASLVSTIIGMAQNFVGSNNVNLLQPIGQFGTRLMGGKDHASGSRIFTQLSPITRYLFHKDDELILNYLNYNGQSIEPKWFIPIIPMVLVNGFEGRGTECSSFIPNYNPREIIANLKRLLNGEAIVPMLPWYKGYEEGFEKTASNTGYITKGKISMDTTNCFSITELPVKTWTQNYKEFLDALALRKDIEGYTAHWDSSTVNFKITMTETQMEKANTMGKLLNKFNLETTLSMEKMYLLDADGKLKKYDTPEQILTEFFDLRREFYKMRKTALLRELKKGVLVLGNKVEYIRQALDGKIAFPKSLYERYVGLNDKGFKSSTSIERAAKQLGWEETREEVNLVEEVKAGGYTYLLELAMVDFFDVDLEKLENEKVEMKKKFDELTTTTADDLWREDLTNLDIQLAGEGYPPLSSSPKIAEEAPKKKALAKRERAAAGPQSSNKKIRLR